MQCKGIRFAKSRQGSLQVFKASRCRNSAIVNFQGRDLCAGCAEMAKKAATGEFKPKAFA